MGPHETEKFCKPKETVVQCGSLANRTIFSPPYLISKELISKIYNELKKLDTKINNPIKMKYRSKERIANIKNSND